MKIGFDARCYHNPGDGFARYVDQLLTALIPLFPDNQFIIFRNYQGFTPHFIGSNVIEIPCKGKPISLKNVLFGEPEFSNYEFDIFHSPLPVFPQNIRTKKRILTFHDSDWFKIPYQLYPLYRAVAVNTFARVFFKQALKQADRIIAISTHTENQLKEISNHQEKVTVIPHGITKHIAYVDHPSNHSFDPNKKFFFTLGTRKRKNIKNILFALNILQKTGFELGDLNYYIVGNCNDEKVELLHLINTLNLSHIVTIVGPVSDHELRYLYENALFFAFVSLNEGFGLPILEAFVHGCPVITSNLPPMNDIAAHAALLVNPHSPEEIARSIKILVKDDNTQNKLRKAGYQQAEKFSWDACAHQTYECYQSSLQNNGINLYGQ